MEYQKYSRLEYKLSPSMAGKVLPRGYFCLWEYRNRIRAVNWLYFNSSMGYENEYMFESRRNEIAQKRSSYILETFDTEEKL